MILFALSCRRGHGFDAWFRNGDTYEKQAAAGEIACPECGDVGVGKAPMAPRLARGRASDEKRVCDPAGSADGDGAPHDAPVPAPAAAGPTPAMLRQALLELRRRIEANATDVGERFAEEARRIHYGEVDPRAIYGRATPEEAEALVDEGVEFGRLPWISVGDA